MRILSRLSRAVSEMMEQVEVAKIPERGNLKSRGRIPDCMDALEAVGWGW